ncbi:MAG: DUF6338 family protein, partial [Verrucomicrobiales bacterium]|nr:DUF6338 family protein [Verrucomicrobiales bacterium]
SPWWTLLACVSIALVQPVCYGALWGRFRQQGYDQKLFRRFGWTTFEQGHAPTAWDAVFSGRPESWVVVTLKDGTKIRGWFGVGSHASSDDGRRDLFVSHVVVREADGSERLAPNTGGVYVSADEIKTVEFFHQA